MKRNLSAVLVLIFILGNICYSDPNSIKRPEGIEPDVVKVVEAVTDDAAEVLIIKDVTPWFSPGNEQALTELGKTYHVINTGDIATTNLSDYRIVIVASDQTTAAYDTLTANKDDLADYASGGGVLLAHACDMGSNGGQWTSSWLPGGVGHLSGIAYASDSLSIVDAASPIVDGISDAALDNWSYSTHGYFTDLVAGTNIVIGITGDPAGQPTYIEYRHGSGWVLATMQTIEWPWSTGQGTQQLLLNEILYAQTLSVKVEVDIKPGSCPNPLNTNSKGVLPVAILGSENFDVTTIDLDYIRLVGVAPLRCSYEDVAAPIADGEECECTEDGPDGYEDLTLKFDTQEIVAALGDVSDGDEVVLTLTSTLLDGTSIESQDCVIIRDKKPEQ